jgi:hypothetical protein
VAGATLTTLSNILKDFYLPPVVEQLNNEVLLFQRLESRSEDLFGKQAIVPVHTARNGGIGPAAEGAALPSAGSQSYQRAIYDLKYFYGRVGVTGPSIAKTSSEAGAFLRALKSELDGIRNDLKKDVARQAYGSGLGNGLIAKCGTTTAANVVVLSSAESVKTGHLCVGMVVDIGTAPGATSVATARNITAVDTTNGTITIDGAAVTTSSSHFVARSGAGANEMLGVTEFVNATANVAVGGLDPSVAGNSVWDNPRLMNGGTPRAISLDLIAQAAAQSRAQGGETSLMIGSLAMERAIFLLLQSQVRYSDPDKLDGGFKAIEVMGKPFVADIDAPWGRINFLDEKQIKVFRSRDWHFLDEDGLTLRQVSGYDKWEAILAMYANVGPIRRNTSVVLGDLTDNGI